MIFLFNLERKIYKTGCFVPGRLTNRYKPGFYSASYFLYTVSFFQGIGKPTCSLLIPLVRQGALLIPIALLSRHRGLDGALFAVPIAKVLTCVLCVIMAYRECSGDGKSLRQPTSRRAGGPDPSRRTQKATPIRTFQAQRLEYQEVWPFCVSEI